MTMNISMTYSKELDSKGCPLTTTIILDGDWSQRCEIQNYVFNLVLPFDLVQSLKDKDFKLVSTLYGKHVYVREIKGIEYGFCLYIGAMPYDMQKTYSIEFYNQAVGNKDTRTIEYLGRSPKSKNEFDILYSLLMSDKTI